MVKKKIVAEEIDLGILDGAAQPTMAEKLYAGRIVAGVTPEPEAGDPSYTAGVRKAVASATETKNHNARLAELADKTNGDEVVNSNGDTYTHFNLSTDSTITEAEIALAEFLEVDLSASTETLLTRVRDNSRTLFVEEIRMGLRLIALKGRLEHGEFIPALAEISINRRSASQAMKTASAFAAEGDDRRRKQLLDMGKSKGAALLAAKPELRSMIMDDPDLSREAQDGSFLELQHLLKEKDHQIDRHQRAYADLETQLEIKGRELQKLSRIDPATLLTRSVRAESVANSAAMGEICDNLIRLADAVSDESIAAEQRDQRQRAVALAIGSAMAHLQALYEAVEDALGESRIVLPSVMDDLTQDEKSTAAQCLAHIRVQFSTRIAQRREEAYADHVAEGGAKKRGRPAKVAGAQQ